MSVVVDASVVVAALTDSGREGLWAEDVIRREDLLAPHLLLVEAANILRRLEKARVLSSAEAAGAYRDLNGITVDLVPFEPFAERVWELRFNVTAYDAWYVAVAEGVALPLASLDRRLQRSSGISCDFLVPAPR